GWLEIQELPVFLTDKRVGYTAADVVRIPADMRNTNISEPINRKGRSATSPFKLDEPKKKGDR
ncbi:unnamed protein product, partial [Calicophoron daubneyi]